MPTPDSESPDPAELEPVTLPSNWEEMTAGYGDDEEITMTEVGTGRIMASFTRRSLAETFADPGYQELMARAREHAKRWQDVPGLSGTQIYVPEGEDVRDVAAQRGLI